MNASIAAYCMGVLTAEKDSLARIFNTYGTRMQIDDGRVVTNFIYQALKNEDINTHLFER